MNEKQALLIAWLEAKAEQAEAEERSEAAAEQAREAARRRADLDFETAIRLQKYGFRAPRGTDLREIQDAVLAAERKAAEQAPSAPQDLAVEIREEVARHARIEAEIASGKRRRRPDSDPRSRARRVRTMMRGRKCGPGRTNVSPASFLKWNGRKPDRVSDWSCPAAFEAWKNLS